VTVRLFLACVGRPTLDYPDCTPPLGILSLAAFVRERLPVEIRLLDQRVARCGSAEVARQAARFRADVVGLSACTNAALMLGEVAHLVRGVLPHALLLLGGPHVSAFGARAVAATCADAGVAGEGELALEQILRARLEGHDLAGIPGVVWRAPTGEVITNPGTLPLIDDLDALPFPAYDLIDLAQYWTRPSMAAVPPRRYVTLLTSRGCPYGCSYCGHNLGRRFRPQSAGRVVAEIEHYQRRYGVREIEFVDDIFNCDPRRVIEFCDLVLRRDLRLRLVFPNALRCDTLAPEGIDALVDAGLYFCCCALESAAPRIQELMGKKLDVGKYLDSVAALDRRGVFTYGFTMLGFPTESETELLQTVDTACASRLHAASFFTVVPYPNTSLHALVQRTQPDKLARVRYEDTNYSGSLVNLSAMPDDVFFAHQRRAWRRFYSRPERIVRLLRRYPRPLSLLTRLPLLAMRMFKGQPAGRPD
jgi:radical SAM superfamily enzyme YgiQ (UPF0313 family)